MKKNGKRLGIALVILTIIIIVIGVVLSIINNNEEQQQENMEIIRDSYTNLSANVIDNIELRKELINKLSTFNNANYPNEHEEYIELLNKYNDNVKQITENVEEMDARCNQEYVDATINILCRSYGDLYEEVVNIYITTVKDYNNKITNYNLNSETDYDLYPMIHEDYIDFNQDGKFQGKDNKTE